MRYLIVIELYLRRRIARSAVVFALPTLIVEIWNVSLFDIEDVVGTSGFQAIRLPAAMFIAFYPQEERI